MDTVQITPREAIERWGTPEQVASLRVRRHTINHGCGRFWMRALIRWDAYDEIVEGWSL